MTPPPTAKTPRRRLALGLIMVGLGREAGFAQFGGTSESFLASLAPLLAFLIVLSAVLAWTRQPLLGLTFFLTALCDLLAPLVIADLFCRLWHKRDRWALYANVLNCAQWLMLAALIVLLPLAAAAASMGMSVDAASAMVLSLFAAYAMWFHWFAARHVLDVSRLRAVLVMLAVVFGTGLLLQAPLVIGRLSGLQTTNTVIQHRDAF
jgi:hypothetical protein